MVGLAVARIRRRVAEALHHAAHHLDGHREDDGRGVAVAHVRQRLQVAQLHGAGAGGHDLCRLDELLRGLQFALGVDDLGAPLPLRLGLAADGADHGLVEVHLLDFHVGDLDAPLLGLGVDDFLHVVVELVALRQHLVEVVLAEHRAQRGLGELAGGHVVVLDTDHRALRVHHPVVEHRVHVHGDVVLGNDVLARHVQGDHPQVHADELLDHRDDDDQAGAFHALEAAEEEDDPPLVLGHDLYGRGDNRDQHDHRRDVGNELFHDT